MLKQLQQYRTQQPHPHTGSKKTLVLWAILGFTIGLSPIIIFLIFFPTTENNKPIKLPPQQARITHNTQTTTEPAPTQTQAGGISPTAPTIPMGLKIQPKPDQGPPVAMAKLKQETEDITETLISTIIYRRWEQSSPESVFPRTRTIECTTNQKEVVCWTDVLTGKHYSREYRYKVKLILDKFRASKQFVMTYRNLILDNNEKSSNEDSGGLGGLPEAIKPGWAPLINRLPCQLAGHDKIVCSPIGEAQFVLRGTPIQTGSR